jgi:sec-independent protein translocase protein TatA
METNMANIGPMEILVVLIIALVVFGPKRLPELGKSLGKGIHEFRGTITGEHTEAAAPAVAQAPVAAAPAPAAETADVAVEPQV